MAGINPPTIPVALQRLFADAGFLSCAEDDQKPSINTRTYARKDSWWDWASRRYNRENPDRTKHFIRSTCEEIAQNLQQYTDTDFYEIILTKMIKLRTGLVKIAETYKSDVSARDHINDSIMLLDMKIPERIKVTHGFSTVSRPQVAPLGRGVIMTSSFPPTLPLPLETPLGVSRGPIPTMSNGVPPVPTFPPPRPPVVDAVPSPPSTPVSSPLTSTPVHVSPPLTPTPTPIIHVSPILTATPIHSSPPTLPLPDDETVVHDPSQQE